MLNDFTADVLKRTSGAVEIQVYGAGQLGSQGNALTGMQTGTIDLVCHTTGFIETIYPTVAVLDLPYLFKTNEQAEKVLDRTDWPAIVRSVSGQGNLRSLLGPLGVASGYPRISSV